MTTSTVTTPRNASQDVISPEIIEVSGANQAANANNKLGVVVGGSKLLLSLTDIIEVLPVPPIQAVPLTKAWFLGMVNVRGNLFSVTDLAQFLGAERTKSHLANRIMLLNSVKTTQVALLIDSLIGLRSLESMQLQAADAATNICQPHLNTSFFSKQVYLDADNVAWQSLDVDALVQDKKFIQPSLA